MPSLPGASVALVAFLLAVPWPFWRLAFSAPVRRRRRDQIVLLATLCLYGAVVIVVAVAWPELLLVLALTAGLASLAIWWRSLPGYGRRRGVPPGRILVHPLGVFTDVEHLEQQAQRYGPIFKIGATFPVPTVTPIVCIVGHELGLELLREHEASLEVYPPFPTSRLIPRGFLRNMTVEDHERYAPLLRQAYSSAIDAPFESAVTASVRRLLAGMVADGAATSDGGIPPAPYLRRFAFDVLARLHFGFESDSSEQKRLAAQLRALDIKQIHRWVPQGARRTQWSAAVQWLRDTGAPPTARSVLGEALALARVSDRSLLAIDEETVVGNVLQMQESGTQDLSDLLLWVVKHLGDHPIWIERVREAGSSAAVEGPPAGGTRSVAERVIRESLRLEQSEFLLRRTTREIAFQGYRLPNRWRVRICIREAHRASDTFDRPTEFDPDRFLQSGYTATEYAPFGLYRHHCLAARAVHTIGRSFVDELARGYQLAIVRGGPREHGRFHWQPSPHLRVTLKPRAETPIAETPAGLAP